MVSERLKMSLLPALHALLETASVTQAAAIMHVTQSTMSRTLSQLREILNDPILVREGNAISLSSKALAIQPQVAKLVNDADSLFTEQTFSPSSSEMHFRIATSPIFQKIFLLKALAEIRKEAPGMRFSLKSTGKSTFQEMEAGNLDLGILQLPETSKPDFLSSKPVARSPIYIVVRKHHPLCQTGVTQLSDLDPYPFLRPLGPYLNEHVAKHIASQCSSIRSPWVELNSLQATLELIKNDDCFSMATCIMCPELLSNPDYQLIPLPEQVASNYLSLWWPEHWHYSQAHQWLRNQLEEKMHLFYRHSGLRPIE
ncbi:LysR family transcriptional regulator [Endozoicomonas lisbonensis]|uniref:DNA-binding transcriptional LysR family regulator n=1 Tax=Endozoicomonas lisbonensis TaxID=3120522 RepID=A0ABV2SDP6_9GAMM